MAKLKPLPYPPTALEPFLDEETVSIHHGKHQAAYVEGWNHGIDRLQDVRKQRIGKASRGRMLRALYEGLTFNGAGVILHEMYWENLCPPEQSGMPSKAFEECALRCFGSPQRLIDEMIDVGRSIRGSGWAVLAWIPRFARMTVLPVQIHQNNWIPGSVPLIVIDVWEHAYYLQYPAGRLTYLQGIWRYINWPVVNRRFREAV